MRIVWQGQGFPARFLTSLFGSFMPQLDKSLSTLSNHSTNLALSRRLNQRSLALTSGLWFFPNPVRKIRFKMVISTVHISNFRAGKKILGFGFTFYSFAALVKVWISLFTQPCLTLQLHLPGSAADELKLRLSKVLPSGLMDKLVMRDVCSRLIINSQGFPVVQAVNSAHITLWMGAGNKYFYLNSKMLGSIWDPLSSVERMLFRRNFRKESIFLDFTFWGSQTLLGQQGLDCENCFCHTLQDNDSLTLSNFCWVSNKTGKHFWGGAWWRNLGAVCEWKCIWSMLMSEMGSGKRLY